MPSSDDFRRLALALPGAEEQAHMGHPDFRVSGKIFASLGYPNDEWGMVVLLSEQQAMAIEAEADAFTPAAGTWGRDGATLVRLDRVPESWMERTLHWAWETKAPRHLRD